MTDTRWAPWMNSKDAGGNLLLCLLVVIATCLQYRTCAQAASVALPPDVIEARHISLNAIRVSWNMTVTSLINVTDVTGFNVALAQENCSHPDEYEEVDSTIKTTTFWSVAAGQPYFVCVQTVTSLGSSRWASSRVANEVRRPPSIVEGPARREIYKPRASLTIPCRAAGQPQPRIQWFWNRKPIKTTDGVYLVNAETGTLEIENAASRHEGSYHCQAENVYGRAVSDSVILSQAVLQKFPPDKARSYLVAPGESLKIPCRRKPHSVPEAVIFWFKRVEDDVIRVEPSHKVTIGEDGSLLFVFVVDSDAGSYNCEVYNKELDIGEGGSQSLVKVEGGGSFHLSPSLLESSPEDVLALVGETARIQCVFGGRPAPDVIWRRPGSRLDPKRHRTADFNRTLTIRRVALSDAGIYECMGINRDERGTQARSHPAQFRLVVHARPTWTKMPRSVNATINDDVIFECRGDGVPESKSTWYINGVEITGQSTASNRYLTSEGDLVAENVRREDLLNVQCNVSNMHGFLFANAYLNVVLPTEITAPPHDVILVPHEPVTFQCGVESDPGTPLTVTWLRGDRPIVFERRRLYVTVDNSLVLNTTNEDDGGRSFIAAYTCVVDNGIHMVNATARLRPPGTTYPYVKEVTAKEEPRGQELVWTGVVAGLAGCIIICLVLFTIVRKRQQSLMVRSGTDTSILTYLSSASRLEDENTRLASVDMTDFPFLPYLDDERLKARIKEVFIHRARIDLGKLLGKGQFGRVYAGVLRDTRGKIAARVAVKTLKYKPEETEIMELFLREAVMMKDFRHPHVLSLIGISVDEDGSPMVVLPLMANSDLRIYVQDPEKEITVLELLKLGLQVARGMVYLSSMRFIHRDLAARNCMVDSNRIVKVADFGLSRDLFSRDYYRIEDGKTPLPVRWMAPESLNRSIFTTTSDVWSYGVLLWELMTRGAVPYPDIDNWDIAHFIQSGKRLAQPLYCPDSIYDIMLACWEEEPERRPTFERIVKDIEVIVNTANTVNSSASHLYLNIHSMAAVSDYREVTHTTV